MDTKSSRSIDEQDFRTYDESESAKLYYMDKVMHAHYLIIRFYCRRVALEIFLVPFPSMKGQTTLQSLEEKAL
jgi:hypothetical protein